MPNTTRIISPTPAPSVTEATVPLPEHWWFWALGIILVAATILFVTMAAVRAPRGEKTSRASSTLLDITMIGGGIYGAIASWVYRPAISAFLDRVLFFCLVLGYWISDMSPAERVWIALVFLIFLYELRMYVKFARMVWRRYNPDFCRRANASGDLNLIGRLYRQERLPDIKRVAVPEDFTRGSGVYEGGTAYTVTPGGWRLHFVPIGGRMLDFLWARHTIDVKDAPISVGRFRVAITATAIERDLSRPRAWRIVNDLQPGFAFGGESAGSLMQDSLEDNKIVSQHGIDGNPHVLAQRATRHQGTHIPVRSRRPPVVSLKPTAPTKNGAEGPKDAPR